MEKINRPNIPPKWKKPWTLERRLCGHNQKLRPKHATNLSYQEACKHGIDTATGTLSIQPCKSFYLCTKVWPGMIACSIYNCLGGAIPLHISTKSQRFWEIQVFTTMFKTLFLHQRFTTWFIPSVHASSLLLLLPACILFRACGIRLLPQWWIGPVPIVIPLYDYWLIYYSTTINYLMSKMYHSMKQQHDFICHHKCNSCEYLNIHQMQLLGSTSERNLFQKWYQSTC